MNTFRALAGEDPYKPLQTSFNEMQVEAVHRWATGSGIRIAIIDTGVDVNHPDLDGQVAEKVDLTGSGLSFEDDIHGTAVAGIIGALSENGLGIEGIAPDARLLALRACWPERSGAIAAVCNSLTLARALDTAILLKTGIVNLSLTGPPDPLIGDLLKVALRDGIIVVAAEPGPASPPGFIDGIDGIIRVSSQGGQGDPPLSGNRGADTIMAPGNDLLTTFPRGTYNFASGSSFAAASVSGIIALLLELQPGLSSQHIEQLLFLGMGQTSNGETRPVSTVFNVCRVAAELRPDFVCADAATSNLLVQKSPAGNFGL
jgi:subtilisin family serine protease